MGDTTFLQQPCWSTTPPTTGAAPAHWWSSNTSRYVRTLIKQEDTLLCLNLGNSLEADADERPELDIHLSVRQVMTHVY